MPRVKATVLFASVALASLPSVGSACPRCRPSVAARVYTLQFGGTLAALLLPLGLMGALAFGVGGLDRPVARRG